MEKVANYETLHAMKLRSIAKTRRLDITHCNSKEAYIKLLKDNDMATIAPSIITQATLEDLKSVGINMDAIRIDKLKADLNELVYNGRKVTRSFKDGKHYYSIDTNDNTIHFLGGCLGPICQTLSCPDGFVTKMAHRYLAANTIQGKDGMKELVN